MSRPGPVQPQQDTWMNRVPVHALATMQSNAEVLGYVPKGVAICIGMMLSQVMPKASFVGFGLHTASPGLWSQSTLEKHPWFNIASETSPITPIGSSPATDLGMHPKLCEQCGKRHWSGEC